MGAHEGWMRVLREQPPVWPQRAEEQEWERPRWDREREPFEEGGLVEAYPGATVLDDLQDTAEEAAVLRILARYTVIRVLLLASCGRLLGPKLSAERRVAMEHLALLPPKDWERHALERLAQICTERPVQSVADAALVAAECAAKRDHVLGAFALYRAAYDLSRSRGWWQLAARAAAGMARLAQLQEARVSTRLWRWRERVLATRAQRPEASAAVTGGGDPEPPRHSAERTAEPESSG
jgi:hypothetical protein